MNEEQLIGEMVDHLLDKYGTCPEITKIGKHYYYKIKGVFLDDEIIVCCGTLLDALRLWDKTLSEKITGRG